MRCQYMYMARKTLYVKEADLPVFEKAQIELGDSLSAILIECVREKLSRKGVTEDAVKFVDVDEKVGINIVPLSKVPFCPRIGEDVLLPGENGDGGTYTVVGVQHTFVDEDESPRIYSVRIDVKRKA